MDRRHFLTASAGFLLLEPFRRAYARDGHYTRLKEAAAGCSLRVGFAASRGKIQYLPGLEDFVQANCNILTPESELKWAAIRPTQESFVFTNGDWLADFAARNGMAFRGHNLCWNAGNPPWLGQVLNRSNAESILTEHIRRVAGHYAGKIDSWDVVNEPIAVWYNRPGGLYPGPWLDTMGKEYMDVAFHAVTQADPKSIRVLNIHRVEHADEAKARTASLNLLESLLQRNVPVQAVGIESHLSATRPIDQRALEEFLHAIRAMGLEVQITELDVNDSKVEGDIPRRDQVVADCYRRYLDVVLPTASVKRLVFWAFTDAGDWMDAIHGAPEWTRADGTRKRPGIVDDSMRIKPAFQSVIASLEAHCGGNPRPR